jgi:hypothetical protein
MYSIVEGEVKDGKVIPIETGVLPDSGHVLIVVLSGSASRANWESCRASLGWLKMSTDAAEWERQVRGEWNHRP